MERSDAAPPTGQALTRNDAYRVANITNERLAMHKNSEIPPTVVGGWFKSGLFIQ